MPDSLPFISIITIVYNGESYLEKTIQSVICQTYPNIEYIIIDGGSSDNTLTIVEKYEHQISLFVSEPDRGIYDAMNKGLALSSGEWVTFLNGGDQYVDSKIIKNIFGSPVKELDFIYGDVIVKSSSHENYIKARPISKQNLKKGIEVCHQSMFARKAIAPAYNLSYKYKAEYNWVIDIFQKIDGARTLHVEMPIVYYALGGFSESGLLTNLKEYIALTKDRYGYAQVIKNIPTYTFIFLRYLKYKFAGNAL